MTIFVPGWMQGGTYTAKQDRVNGRAELYDEGVMKRTSYKVVQRALGANMTVEVAPGNAIVTGDDQADQGNYSVHSDGTVSVAGFVATGSNTRYDLVGIQINDPDAGGAAGSNATIVRIAGTAAASPVIPAIPASFLLLAIVGPFTTSTSSITNAMIHDCWTGTGPTGVTGARLLAGFRAHPGTTQETYNAVAPNGWLIEDGSAISRTTYADLFEHFGVTFGAGNGTTTFNLPNSRGRVFVALDNQGGSDAGVLSVANTLGGTGGEELHALSTAELASHSHTNSVSVQSADHTHSGTTGTESATHTHHQDGDSDGLGGGGFIPVVIPSSTPTDAESATHTHSFTTAGMSLSHIHTVTINNAGSGTAHNNLQPYILGYRIVRT